MAIQLRDITPDNFNECVDLKLRADQDFVYPNSFSLAQSKYEDWWIPQAIYVEKQMVGFVMYSKNYRPGQLYIARLMIDLRFQAKGYGKATLDLIKQIALADKKILKLCLSTSPKNLNAIRIYEKFGFINTGILEEVGPGEDEEYIYELVIKEKPVLNGNTDSITLLKYTSEYRTLVIDYLDQNRKFQVNLDPLNLRTSESTWAEKEFMKIQQVLDENSGAIFMIHADANSIGFIYYYDEVAGKISAHMSKLFIETEYRGLGYGKAALSLFEAELKQLGYKFISLNVFAPNNAAIALYTKMGFQDRFKDMLKPI